MEPKEQLQRNIGIRIRNLRIEKGLTQVDLASKINRDQQSIQRLEAGRTNPTYLYLYEVAQGLEISLSELLDF